MFDVLVSQGQNLSESLFSSWVHPSQLLCLFVFVVDFCDQVRSGQSV